MFRGSRCANLGGAAQQKKRDAWMRGRRGRRDAATRGRGDAGTNPVSLKRLAALDSLLPYPLLYRRVSVSPHLRVSSKRDTDRLHYLSQHGFGLFAAAQRGGEAGANDEAMREDRQDEPLNIIRHAVSARLR